MTPSTLPHVLPGESGGDTRWFERLNTFEQQETCRQVKFKRQRWPELPDGRFSKLPQHTYPHILPLGDPQDANLEKSFFPEGAKEILDYMQSENIALHSEALNLRSSQVACLNILFPLHQDLDLAAAIFGQLFPGLRRVSGIEFEYTGQDEYPGTEGIVDWLGEPPGGKRGQNRTSIDAAFFWEDQGGEKRAALIEWKYTERAFGSCSAFNRARSNQIARYSGKGALKTAPTEHAKSAEKSKTTPKIACEQLNVWERAEPARSCLLCIGEPQRRRRYWEHMQAAGIRLEAFHGVSGCPFQGPLYQLMRQTLLAGYLRQQGIRAQVVSMSFAGNASLHRLPGMLKPLGGGDLIEAWNRVLSSITPPLLDVTVEKLLAAADRAGGVDEAWRGYVKERYGL